LAGCGRRFAPSSTAVFTCRTKVHAFTAY